jgi:hypothetical protein
MCAWLPTKSQAELVEVAGLVDVAAFDEDFVDVTDFADVVDLLDVDSDCGAHLSSIPVFEPLPHQRLTRRKPRGSWVALLRVASQSQPSVCVSSAQNVMQHLLGSSL